MVRPLAFVVAAFLFAGTAPAEDKKDKDKPALSGTWTREANGLDLKFEFVGKETVKIFAFHDDNGVIATCKYTADKDGLVKAKITDVEVKGEFKNKPAKGAEFSFKWAVKGDTATLDDLKGDDLEHAKPVLEGEYAKKKDKK
ncbi:MAG: hypothetical protein JWO38_6676 [Gemmataceae bacterium]|nr:hypothetical protein [Gemmataceae bacterium]